MSYTQALLPFKAGFKAGSRYGVHLMIIRGKICLFLHVTWMLIGIIRTYVVGAR